MTVLCASCAAPGAQQGAPSGGTPEARARAVHHRVLALDTHVDIEVADFTPSRNYTQRLDTQVNLPKMEDGGLDAAFFVVYVAQPDPAATPDAFEPSGYARAYQAAIAKFDAIHRLAADLGPGRIALARTAAEVRRIHASGRKVALIGVENGYPIGSDLRRVHEFFERGARYMSLAHNGHSQLADSHTGEADGWKWNGLSPLGREVVAEMNRLGMLVDVSHTSKAAMLEVARLSRAPIIASHSAARALCNHSRNLDDEQLLAIEQSGGVVQTVAYGPFLKATDTPERTHALDALRKEFGLPAGTPLGRTRAGAGGRALRGAALAALNPERREALERRVRELDASHPPRPPASVVDLVDHIDYVVRKIGIEHVGISSDFDGGGGIDGWRDASETFNVTRELVRRGYTEEQIAAIWSGNLLRVMERAATAAAAAPSR